MTIIRSSDLDFDTIKANLKTYLQAKSEFADYDFEASGLNNILDVLAYNTHINGLIANFAINESFLNSAQLRSSVVSHAETVGYYPASKTGATATIGLTVTTSDTVTSTSTISAFTTFTGTLGDTTYTFQTLEAHTATNDGTGIFEYKTDDGLTAVKITEGTQKTKTFLVGETTDNQVYVIPDANLDKTTLKVDVFDTTTSSTFNTYNDIESVVRIDATSKVYIIRETPNGNFEIIFGEGNVLGQSPTAGNKIVITYLATNGADANSISSFTADSTITIGGTGYTPTVTTTINSAGGSEKESIESIKANAPLSFASQQRLVTAEDYQAIISQRFTQLLDDVVSWGGEENIPATFGDVYVSLKFKDNISSAVQTATKNTIQNVIAPNLGVMSIDVEFVDPIDTFIELAITFDFDPDLTNLTLDAIQSNIKTEAAIFFTANLGNFNSVFRKSAILTTIDAISPAILNSDTVVKVQQSFTPTLNTVADYEIAFPVALAVPDDVNRILQSTPFTINGSTCVIRNKLSSTTLEIFDATNGTVIFDNIGNYNQTTGKVSISGFGGTVTGFSGSAIKISVTPANQNTIKPLRNYIIKLDTGKTSAAGTIDFQNTATTLTI
jgi:hypothetical protein